MKKTIFLSECVHIINYLQSTIKLNNSKSLSNDENIYTLKKESLLWGCKVCEKVQSSFTKRTRLRRFSSSVSSSTNCENSKERIFSSSYKQRPEVYTIMRINTNTTYSIMMKVTYIINISNAGVKKSLVLEPGTSRISIRTSKYFHPMSEG